MRLQRHLAHALVLLSIIVCTYGASAAPALQATGIIRATYSGCSVTWVQLTITNRTGAAHTGTIKFGEYSRRGEGVDVPIGPIPAGATHNLNVAVPLIGVSYAELQDAGGHGAINIDSSYRYGTDSNRDFLLVDSRANQLNDTELDDFTRDHAPKTHYPYMRSSSSSTTSPLMASERNITQMEPSELPENWLCYLPLRCIFISENVERQLTPGQLQAISTWVRLGGNVIYYDSQQADRTQVGRGTISRAVENPVTSPHANFTRYSVASTTPGSLANSSVPYAEPYTGGRTVLFIFITAFLILVGPANYVYHARRNQIRKLLKTVPAISMGFCGLIAVYFLATEGFARKGGSMSLTLLNEASNRAITFAQHSLSSGLYPTGGFHFSRETYLHPTSATSDTNLEITLGKDFALTDGLFRPKIPFNYMTVTPHTTRERLVIDPSGDSVRNGFELPVKAVAVYRDGEYFSGGSGASGAAIDLKPARAPRQDANANILEPQPSGTGTAARNLVQLLEAQDMTLEEKIFLQDQARVLLSDYHFTTGTLYAAIFDGVPPAVEPGVTIKNGEFMHIVIGQTDEGNAE